MVTGIVMIMGTNVDTALDRTEEIQFHGEITVIMRCKS
jgi:hypothetical protein